MSSFNSSITAASNDELENPTDGQRIDLLLLPPVMVLSAHLTLSELHKIENRLLASQATLTYSTTEARIFLGKVEQKRRALLELRSRGISTEELHETTDAELSDLVAVNEEPSRKKRKLTKSTTRYTDAGAVGDDSTTESDADDLDMMEEVGQADMIENKTKFEADAREADEGDRITLVSVRWLNDSFDIGEALPLRDYTIYKGRVVLGRRKSAASQSSSNPTDRGQPATRSKTAGGNPSSAKDILARALADPVYRPYIPASHKHNTGSYSRGPVPGAASGTQASLSQSHARTAYNPKRMAQLLHESTSEHESATHDLPEMPQWVKDGLEYSCQRTTPLTGPNDAFIDQLKKIRTARDLTNDQIGVRAYSTAIAAIAAYPFTVTSPREIVALPGCDFKIASLWAEWKNRDGRIDAVEDAENDERLTVLRLFHGIWGVGPHTAREFYDKGWRELDDIVEFGWSELSRVQQIGVKYYDEFQLGIPRDEVERIARMVHEHAQRVREPSGVRTCIVGGYRRGKVESGDVDVIVSHLDIDATLNIVTDIVASLVEEGWITHELKTNLTSTKRGQVALPVKSSTVAGSGFDTLDKSMVVWQEQVMGVVKGEKNPNPHRRVDIIIAPWDKVGCAVMGWSGGTTFQRDVRRYARKVKGWKFDSSGIRDRSSGQFMDLEAVGGRNTSCEEAEKKVFAGLGLEWREPWERCTG